MSHFLYTFFSLMMHFSAFFFLFSIVPPFYHLTFYAPLTPCLYLTSSWRLTRTKYNRTPCVKWTCSVHKWRKKNEFPFFFRIVQLYSLFCFILKDVSMPFPVSCLIFLVLSYFILPHSIGRHFFGMSPSYHLLGIDMYLEEEGRTMGYSRWGWIYSEAKTALIIIIIINNNNINIWYKSKTNEN